VAGGPTGLKIVFAIPPCVTDRRANRLESWSCRPGGRATQIYLCTAKDVLDQLVASIVHLEYHVSLIEVAEPDDRRKWTHALEIDGAVTGDIEDLLELFHSTLVLPRPAGMESAMALDWYKDPTSHEDPRQWANTAVGQLVQSAKYHNDRAALANLCDRLAETIGRHPIYRECILASVPGHKRGVSNGEKVAAGVAERVGKTLIKTTARSPNRPAAKSGEDVDLTHEFQMDENAMLRNVLVVDDTMHSGRTMSGVAAAAKRAGASSVHGIVGARTLRK